MVGVPNGKAALPASSNGASKQREGGGTNDPPAKKSGAEALPMVGRPKGKAALPASSRRTSKQRAQGMTPLELNAEIERAQMVDGWCAKKHKGSGDDFFWNKSNKSERKTTWGKPVRIILPDGSADTFHLESKDDRQQSGSSMLRVHIPKDHWLPSAVHNAPEEALFCAYVDGNGAVRFGYRGDGGVFVATEIGQLQWGNLHW